jgi:MFS superfamily sulfate permease-like transporter
VICRDKGASVTVTNRVDRILTTVHAYHLAALSTERLSRENIELSVKLAVNATAASPLLTILAAILILLSPIIDLEPLKVPSAIVVLVIVFGIGHITDRQHRQYGSEIKSRALAILKDPEQGCNWARGRLFAFVCGQLLLVFALAVFVRAVFVSPGPY